MRSQKIMENKRPEEDKYEKKKIHKTKEAQLKTLKSLKNFKPPTNTVHFHSSNHQKWLHFKILGGQAVKNVQIDPQTTEIWLKKLNMTF